MITIDPPSMALNDIRATVVYRMTASQPVLPSTSIRRMVDLVIAVAGKARGGKIRNLILNAHGLPGFFQLGTGLNYNTMAPFADVNGKVSKIWFRGCLVARVMGAGTASHGDGVVLRGLGITQGDGNRFISAFARLTGCYVVAPTEMQVSTHPNYPMGRMDTYEGLTLCYDPQGRISWQRRYPSLYGYDVKARVAITPNRE